MQFDACCLICKSKLPPQYCIDVLLRERWVISQDTLSCNSCSYIVDHGFKRHTSSVEAGLAAKYLGIDTHDVLKSFWNGGQHSSYIMNPPRRSLTQTHKCLLLLASLIDKTPTRSCYGEIVMMAPCGRFSRAANNWGTSCLPIRSPRTTIRSTSRSSDFNPCSRRTWRSAGSRNYSTTFTSGFRFKALLHAQRVFG